MPSVPVFCAGGGGWDRTPDMQETKGSPSSVGECCERFPPHELTREAALSSRAREPRLFLSLSLPLEPKKTCRQVLSLIAQTTRDAAGTHVVAATPTTTTTTTPLLVPAAAPTVCKHCGGTPRLYWAFFLVSLSREEPTGAHRHDLADTKSDERPGRCVRRSKSRVFNYYFGVCRQGGPHGQTQRKVRQVRPSQAKNARRLLVAAAFASARPHGAADRGEHRPLEPPRTSFLLPPPAARFLLTTKGPNSYVSLDSGALRELAGLFSSEGSEV